LENLRERDHLELRRRWEDNIKIDSQEDVWRDMELLDLAEDSGDF
jgi:hypothetical protein